MTEHTESDNLDKISGVLRSVTNKEPLDRRSVWFAYTTVDGSAETLHATTGSDGSFVFDPPTARLAKAHIGADVEGAAVVDLEPGGATLEPGDLVVIVDDITPAHLRTGG